MKLRELYQPTTEDIAVSEVAIIFGRFNPPHQGHKAAWELASGYEEWLVGTNQSTVGPKDPLPFKIKVEAMKAVWPEVGAHLVASQSWWTLAADVYARWGEVTLYVVTDKNDAKIFVPGLQKSNGVQAAHGYYKFKKIVWVEAPRISSATNLRAAVANDDPEAFEQAAGVPANTEVAGQPFFDLVKHYLSPYLQQAADKEAEKAEKEKVKAEKDAAKKQKEPNLAEQVAQLEKELAESTQKKISKRQQQSTAGLNTYGDSEHVSGDYTGYRLGMAVACADGKTPIDMEAKSWIGKKKSTHPYTKEEQDMLKQAYKAVGASYKDINHGDMESKELETVHSISPVAPRKKNKYGI